MMDSRLPSDSQMRAGEFHRLSLEFSSTNRSSGSRVGLPIEQLGFAACWRASAGGRWFWGPGSIIGQIEPLAESRLRFPASEEMDFGIDGNVSLKDRGSGMRLRSMEYRRVPEYQPGTADLLQFSGTYSSKESWTFRWS
jgi:hypothetical protein